MHFHPILQVSPEPSRLRDFSYILPSKAYIKNQPPDVRTINNLSLALCPVISPHEPHFSLYILSIDDQLSGPWSYLHPPEFLSPCGHFQGMSPLSSWNLEPTNFCPEAGAFSGSVRTHLFAHEYAVTASTIHIVWRIMSALFSLIPTIPFPLYKWYVSVQFTSGLLGVSSTRWPPHNLSYILHIRAGTLPTPPPPQPI